jgi:hypothetical protein
MHLGYGAEGGAADCSECYNYAVGEDHAAPAAPQALAAPLNKQFDART